MTRTVSAIVGGALLVRGLRRRSLPGTVAALVGGWLLLHGLGGGRGVERLLRSRRGIGGEAAEPRSSSGTTFSRTVTVGKPADELYEAWRDPEQFSRVMGHFAQVTAVDEDRFRWTVDGPGGRAVSWETRVVDEEPGEFLRWESPPDAMLPNEGSVRFRPAPGDRGTAVTLSISVDPPGGALGTAAIQRLDVVPKAVAGTALRRFKSLVESGEIQTLEGNPSGRGRGDRL